MTEQRIYYEDTDAIGVVYYANYLRYFERGRAEYMRERGLSIWEIHKRGYSLPVVRLEIDYHAPAVYDDLIRVETSLLEIGKASFTLGQRVVRASDSKLLVDGKVTMVCVGPERRARRLPAELLQVLSGE
jgi:acyl-CoA thioester hydrolase